MEDLSNKSRNYFVTAASLTIIGLLLISFELSWLASIALILAMFTTYFLYRIHLQWCALLNHSQQKQQHNETKHKQQHGQFSSYLKPILPLWEKRLSDAVELSKQTNGQLSQ